MARLPCLWLGACAPIRWEVGVGPCCRSTPFLWCLPKETVSSRQRKALFYLGGSTIRVSAAASVVVTHLRPTWGGAGAGFWAHRAFESFARLFKGGGVQGRSPCPRSAERGTLLVLHKAQEGVQGGTLAGGSPFYFCTLYVCADTLGGGRWPVLPFDPISLVLAQRNGVEPPKKSAFEASTSPWWAHPPLPFGRKPQRDELVRQVGLYTVG